MYVPTVCSGRYYSRSVKGHARASERLLPVPKAVPGRRDDLDVDLSDRDHFRHRVRPVDGSPPVPCESPDTLHASLHVQAGRCTRHRAVSGYQKI